MVCLFHEQVFGIRIIFAYFTFFLLQYKKGLYLDRKMQFILDTFRMIQMFLESSLDIHNMDLLRSWQSDSLHLWRRGFDPYRLHPQGVAVDPWIQSCLVGQ
jgi:hypothetical protein